MNGYNAEHYRDTTAQKAIENIEREERRRIVELMKKIRRLPERRFEAGKFSYARIYT